MKSKELTTLYRLRFARDQLERRNSIWKVICTCFLQSFVYESDVVIDVACGYGEFINNINARKKIAVDLNPDAADSLNSNIEYCQCDASAFASKISEAADVIFTSNFLEHLADKKCLDEFLGQIMTALKPGGRYLIMGPNLRYLPGRYWDFYDHHLGLTHLSLCEALKLRGFEITHCIDRFLPYTTQSSLPTHPWLVWLYINVPLVWRFVGKQFFVVARKPRSVISDHEH